MCLRDFSRSFILHHTSIKLALLSFQILLKNLVFTELSEPSWEQDVLQPLETIPRVGLPGSVRSHRPLNTRQCDSSSHLYHREAQNG